MAKGKDQQKKVKKEPAKTPKEKRAEKKLKEPKYKQLTYTISNIYGIDF